MIKLSYILFNYTSFSEVAPNSSFAMEFNDTINYVHGCILDGNIILGTKDEKNCS